MDLTGKGRKYIGSYGERAAAEYLRGSGYRIIARNIARKTGELDIIARKGENLHFVEVKSVLRKELPIERGVEDEYSPGDNLHPMKLRRVERTAEWYVAEVDWEGEWQIDGILVFLRERDGVAKIELLPQIV